MREFLSFLAPQLRAYLALRTRLGFTSFAQGNANHYYANDLDQSLTSFQIRSFDQMTEDLVMRWLLSIGERSAATRNGYLVFAYGFFEYLVRHGHLLDNPARRVLRFKRKPYAPYIYTLREIQQILEAVRRRPVHARSPLASRTLETLLFLLYACGLRLGEALHLKIRDVDFEENGLSLWNTKFHKERLVPFSPAVAQVLKGYLVQRRKHYPPAAPDHPFFCHAGGKYSRPSIQIPFREILRSLGLARAKGPRIHDLRHAFACHRLYKWYQEGHNLLNKLPLLSTYMGHVEIEYTQVYLTITQALLREGDKRFSRDFEDVARKAVGRVFKAF